MVVAELRNVRRPRTLAQLRRKITALIRIAACDRCPLVVDLCKIRLMILGAQWPGYNELEWQVQI